MKLPTKSKPDLPDVDDAQIDLSRLAMRSLLNNLSVIDMCIDMYIVMLVEDVC